MSNQRIWGPHLWFFLHTVSFTYPINPTPEDKQNVKEFFLALRHVIPCSVCKKNYKRHLKESNIDEYLVNRKSLVHWVIDLHNLVNIETGKSIMSHDKAIKIYERIYKRKIILSSIDEKSQTSINPKPAFSRYNMFCYKNFMNVYFLIILTLLLLVFFNKFSKKLF